MLSWVESKAGGASENDTPPAEELACLTSVSVELLTVFAEPVAAITVLAL
jgi:hypothetical protein